MRDRGNGAEVARRSGRRSSRTIASAVALASLIFVTAACSDDESAQPVISTRFVEAFAVDTAAVVTGADLPDPTLVSGAGTPGFLAGGGVTDDPDSTSAQFVVLDGSELAMSGVVIDLPDRLDAVGPEVDVGVEGARFIDDQQGAIVIPLDQGDRIVALRQFLQLQGGGPFAEQPALEAVASQIGQSAIGDVPDIAGVYVTSATQASGITPLVTDEVVTVIHGDSTGQGVSTSLVRLSDTPTAEAILAIGYDLTGGELDDPELGDEVMTRGPGVYIELLSPVDLLIISGPGDVSEYADSLEFVSAATLDS